MATSFRGKLLFTEQECVLLDEILKGISSQGPFKKVERKVDKVSVTCYQIRKDWFKLYIRNNDYDYPFFLEKHSNAMMYLPLEYTSKQRIKQKLEIMKQGILNMKPLVMKTVKVSTKLKDFIPRKLETFEPFCVYDDVVRILKTGRFTPAYIHGLSGCGKTEIIKQACADQGRELIVTNIHKETDESDLLGHYTLVNGATVWQEGPVISAMKRGAVLLLDEVDLAGPKLMCLQSILNGDGYYVKKIKEMVYPADGFTVFATANTKGRGDSTGSFIGTNIQNEAALDRYQVAFEQDYPPAEIERKILTKNLMQAVGLKNEDDVEKVDLRYIRELVNLADMSRHSYREEEIAHVITTRRLIAMLMAYIRSGERDFKRSFDVGFERFDKETIAFLRDMIDKSWKDIFDDKTDDAAIYEAVATADDILDDDEYDDLSLA